VIVGPLYTRRTCACCTFIGQWLGVDCYVHQDVHSNEPVILCQFNEDGEDDWQVFIKDIGTAMQIMCDPQYESYYIKKRMLAAFMAANIAQALKII